MTTIATPLRAKESVEADPSKLLPAVLRDDFPILTQMVHGDRPLVFLDNAASTQRPRQVIEVLRRVYERDYANVHRGIHTLSERSTEQYEEAREKVRAFIGARNSREIIFTSGTTAGINIVARSWGDANVKAGDEILVTTMEHHSNLVPWHQLAERTGAVIKHIPITDDGLLDPRRARHAAHRSHEDRRRRVRSRTSLGTINPVAEIARRAHAAGAVVLVDAAQSVPHLPTDVQAMDADFLAFSGHKMLGPTGIGVLYGREELLDAMPPFLGGGSMINRVWDDHFTPAELPAKFEAGTPPIAPAIALGAAIDYLNRDRPRSRAAPRTRVSPLCLRAAAGDRRPANPRPVAGSTRRPRELHAASTTRTRCGPASRPARHRRPRRPPLHLAAARPAGNRRQHTGQLLPLQHAGRGRLAG